MTTAREETSRLADLLRREHHALAEFLVALAEFDRRKLWVQLGHASLFAFLRRELRLSAGAAQYRKTAAELIQRYPEVEARLRSGDLCLSSVAEVAKVITPENAGEVLPRFFGLSSRDAAFVAASIRPVQNPPRRDFSVTPVWSAPALASVMPAVAQASVAPPSHGEASVAQAPVAADDAPPLRAPEMPPSGIGAPAFAPAPSPPAPVLDRPKIRPLDAERARVNMTVPRRLLDKLAAARDVLSHAHPGATEEQILEIGLDLIIQRHAKRRGIGARPRATAAPAQSSVASAPASPSASTPPPRSRHVPAAVWRGVWERDQGCCAWPLENGGVCGSTWQLELDHVNGWALGAETTIDACRLLCRFHQDVSARHLFGDDRMNDYTRPKGGTCSEPVAAYASSPASASSPPSPSRAGRCRGPCARLGTRRPSCGSG